jgi:hypothetical protein
MTGDEVARLWGERGIDGLRLGWWPPEKVLRYAAMYQPRREGERNTKLLAYVRALMRLDIDWLPHRLRVAFKVWWRYARMIVRTKPEVTTFKQFLDACDLCPVQTPGLDVARLRQESKGAVLPSGASIFRRHDQVLLRACIRLQRLHGEEPFFLSYEDAGRLLGVAKATARLALLRLLKADVLERVSVGSNLTGRASKYRCLVPIPNARRARITNRKRPTRD